MFDYRVLTNPEFISFATLSFWSIVVALRAWLMRNATLLKVLFYTASLLGVWFASQALNLFILDPSNKLSWLALVLFLFPLIPVFTTWLVMLYTLQPPSFVRSTLAVQVIIASIFFLLLFTNEYHQLMWSRLEYRLSDVGARWVLVRGPAAIAQIYYNIAVILFESVLLLRFSMLVNFRTLNHVMVPVVGLIFSIVAYFAGFNLQREVPFFAPSVVVALVSLSIICLWALINLRHVGPIARNSVFDSLTQMVFILDPNLALVDINNKGQTELGISAGENIKRHISDLRGAWPELIQFCLNLPQMFSPMQKIVVEREVQRVRESGLIQHFEVRAIPVYSYERALAGWTIVLNNITERKRSETILANETRRLNLLYKLSQSLSGYRTSEEVAQQAIHLIVSVLNLDAGEVALLNAEDESLHILASSHQPIYQAHYLSAESSTKINPKPRLRIGEGLTGSAAKRQKLTLSTSLEEDPRWGKGAFPQPDVAMHSGAAIPLFVGATLIGVLTLLSSRQNEFQNQDIPLFNAIAITVALALQSAKRYEETRQRSELLEKLSSLSAALRAANSRKTVMEAVLDHCLQYFEVEDGDIRIPAADQSGLKLGFSRNRQLGRGVRAATINGQLYRKLYNHVFQKSVPYFAANLLHDPLVEADESEMIRQNYEGAKLIAGLYAPLRDGETVVGVIGLRTTAIQDLEETDLPTLVAFADIAGQALQRSHLFETLEQRVEDRTKELEEANKLLSELDQLKDEFIANVNHELRTPLTNIKLYLGLLADGKASTNPERYKKYLDVLQNEANHLSHLLDTSLDISKLDEARRIPGSQRYEQVDLREIVSACIEAHTLRAQDKGLEIGFDASPQRFCVTGNGEQLNLAISNLLSNAIDYSDHGAIQVTLNLAENKTENKVENKVQLMIQDSGYGIPADELSKIWNRFYRGRRVRQSTKFGYGLGLSIVKEIIEMHHGVISVESQENIGSTFEIQLPLLDGNTIKSPNGFKPIPTPIFTTTV